MNSEKKIVEFANTLINLESYYDSRNSLLLTQMLPFVVKDPSVLVHILRNIGKYLLSELNAK